MRIHKSYIFRLSNFYIVAAALLLAACDSYLDELPDNRMEVTSAEKVNKLLVTAYPTSAPILVAEYSSDNVDSYQDNPNSTRFIDQVYHWSDITESNNESTENFWESSYETIATANLALESIDELGGATTPQLQEARGEALLCRAYAHFMLVNIFSQAYNSQTSDTDLGIVYMDATATDITANPVRLTVSEVYKKIESDLLEALPLVGSNYSVPKYHFNQKAAYAFACRFYLYYEQWDKAIEYADKCLGSAPQAMLRDWRAMAGMTQTFAALSQHYIDATLNCNLLLLTAYSAMGIVFGPYNYWSRYAHGKYLARHEDGEANNIWGSARFFQGMHTYAATNLDKTIFFKLPYLFEYVDAVAGTGYYRTVYPAFTADECLLNRAEAYVLTGRYQEAAADLTMWLQNIIDTNLELTPDDIMYFYNSVDYAYSDALGIASSIKKHLHPTFDIGQEGDIEEAMLQCVLGFRRIETLQTGLRWYDVKRYGIEIVRREIDAAGEPAVRIDVLKTGDARRALQIPFKVRAAGVQPNPRNDN
ncbi:MAG: RagB/SusD family nutrient uptake outer membrane protein [Prevotella sp.]|nr:RagB/SusD family nutrient uptake outer membrane protein [Prevotella sp.]